jgi:hypothetical protein
MPEPEMHNFHQLLASNVTAIAAQLQVISDNMITRVEFYRQIDKTDARIDALESSITTHAIKLRDAIGFIRVLRSTRTWVLTTVATLILGGLVSVIAYQIEHPGVVHEMVHRVTQTNR